MNAGKHEQPPCKCETHKKVRRLGAPLSAAASARAPSLPMRVPKRLHGVRGGGAREGCKQAAAGRVRWPHAQSQQCVLELLQRGVVGEAAGQRHSTSIAKGVTTETGQGERQRGEVAGRRKQCGR